MKAWSSVTCAALLAAVACSGPLEFAEWTIPVPEGIEVVEYAHVPFDGRAGARIEWVDELVIGDRGEVDARYAFSRPSDVAVDAAGQIYVVDREAAAVSVFDGEGEYLRQLGREGQGPGEFQSPRSVVSMGDMVIVTASRNARLSHFDLRGNHLGDYAFPIFDNLTLLLATPAGELIGGTMRFTEAQEVVQEIAVYTPQAEKLRTYATLTSPNTPTIQRGTRWASFSSMPNASPTAVSSPDGDVYQTGADEYQVLAVGSDTLPRWALRVAWSPSPLPRQQIDAIMAMVRGSYEDATESEVNFPDRQPAIARLLVDGHGHLYVFPYVWVPGNGDDGVDVPVDVYAPDGRRLFAGTTPPRYWTHADGDIVWEIATDAETSEWVVRKSRLVEPFE
jgi:hypothetical protein